jgi:hypothetical protein
MDFSRIKINHLLILAFLISLIFVLATPLYGMGGINLRGKGHIYKSNNSFINKESNWYTFQGGLELGFLDVISHTIQFGTNGTNFDYVNEGGQSVLFPFSRITAEIILHDRHNFIFLIQPLEIRTSALLKRNIVIDDLTFPENSHINLKYGFTFYRISYLYDFNKEKDKELALGLSLQLRNASIIFASADGSLLRTNENVGPVPIFKFRYRRPINKGFWIGAEADGFYASGKYITGSENDFEGAIIDASIRFGFELTNYLDTYFNIRYLGGGAKGTDENDPGPGDGFTDNWLKTISISLGFYIR